MKPELLAPAGDWPSLNAALEAGADAIYLGIKGFNMRANAKNFEIKDFKRIRETCQKKKVYLTLNIILYDKELKKTENLIKKAKPYVNAIICWDPSIIQLCKKHKVPFHISTQASISNLETAKFYKKLGAKAIVLARELSLNQVKHITKNIDIKVEAFIHGAMCYSVSGRCFFSQEMYGRSANRGECVQPCRRKYTLTDQETGKEIKVENNYFLSAKDLCTLPFLKKVVDSGISILKIEGRNRSPEYVYNVTKAYRDAIDSNSKDISKLEEVYNRKFSSGFFLGLPTSDDITDLYGSNATKKKIVAGKVTNYYNKLKVALVELQSADIQIGDQLNIIGNKTGLLQFKAERLEINHKQVKKAKKGSIVAIKVEKQVRPNDKLYKIIQRKL
jgi:U32 family peptidase